jgi:DNA-binding NarL/FixJ family response regulator
MMSTAKATVILADDHPIVVDGVKEILKTMDGLMVTGTASNGTDLLQLVRQSPANLVILDVNMPGTDGIQCTRQIKKEFPATKVLILTMYDDRALINEMISAGADGCMLKSKGSADMREAITRVLDGKSYFDSIPNLKDVKADEPLNLTNREIDIIKLSVKGKSTQEIADMLFISEHTVKTHRKNIFRKLNINAVTQLNQFAVAHGWI